MTDYSELVKKLRDLHRDPRPASAVWLFDNQIALYDAAAAIEELLECVGMLGEQRSYWIDKAAEYYNQLPKRGEIVRCGECKWYGIYEAKKDGTPDKRYSPSVCLRGIYAKRRDPDWYCADGEREMQDER